MCYCLDCRKMSGNLGHLVSVYYTTDVEFKDPDNKLKTFIKTKTDSGKPVEVKFCGECGVTFATIQMQYDGKFTILRPSVFDDGADDMKPTHVVHKHDLKQELLDTIAKL